MAGMCTDGFLFIRVNLCDPWWLNLLSLHWLPNSWFVEDVGGGDVDHLAVAGADGAG